MKIGFSKTKHLFISVFKQIFEWFPLNIDIHISLISKNQVLFVIWIILIKYSWIYQYRLKKAPCLEVFDVYFEASWGSQKIPFSSFPLFRKHACLNANLKLLLLIVAALLGVIRWWINLHYFVTFMETTALKLPWVTNFRV